MMIIIIILITISLITRFQSGDQVYIATALR